MLRDQDPFQTLANPLTSPRDRVVSSVASEGRLTGKPGTVATTWMAFPAPLIKVPSAGAGLRVTALYT